MKSFIIGLKDNKGNDNLPNRQLVGKIGEQWVDVGVGWAKQKTDGTPYISVKLNEEKTYQNAKGETVPVKGWILVEEKKFNDLLKERIDLQNKLMISTGGSKELYGEADPSEIPF